MKMKKREARPTAPRRALRGGRGFTLIELLLVVVIIGILAAIVVPSISGSSEKARQQASVTQIAIFVGALQRYEMNVGKYPTSTDGLISLIELPGSLTDPKKWTGPDLEALSLPLDPWGNDYKYEFPGTLNPNTYDLYSCGPDGQANTEDDVKRH